MKKYIIPLSIVAATFAASCSSDENLPQEIDNSMKTPIEFSMTDNTSSMNVGVSGVTRAGFTSSTDMVVKMVAEEVQVGGTSTTPTARKSTITKATAENQSSVNKKDDNTSYTYSNVSFNHEKSEQRYWDDAYGRNTQLSIFAVAVKDKTNSDKFNDLTASSWTDESNISSAMSWPITWTVTNESAQTESSINDEDLVYSNNIQSNGQSGKREYDFSISQYKPVYDLSNGRLEFQLKESDKADGPGKFDTGNLNFTHALSRITLKIKLASEFGNNASLDDNEVKVLNMPYTGTLDVVTGQFTSTSTKDAIVMAPLSKSGSDIKGIYMAQVLPGYKIAQNSNNMLQFKVYTGEMNNPTSQNIYYVTNNSVYSAIESNSAISSEKDENGITMAQGKHYILTITVGKTAIKDITATLVDWTNVEGTLEQNNAYLTFTNAFKNSDSGTTSAADNFDLYRLNDPSTDVSTDGNYKSYDWKSKWTDKAELTKDNSSQETGKSKWTTKWFFDDNKSFYHFRMVGQKADGEDKTRTIHEDATNGDYFDIESGTTAGNYTWGAPFVSGADLKYSTTSGYDNANGENHNIHYAIGATNDNIHLTSFHMLSQIRVVLKTVGASQGGVNLQSGEHKTTVKITNVFTKGKVNMGNGLVTAGKNSYATQPTRETAVTMTAPQTFFKNSSSNLVTNEFTYFIVPQTLVDDKNTTETTDDVYIGLEIQTPDNNIYYVVKKLSEIKASSVGDNGTQVKDQPIKWWYPNHSYLYTITLKKTGIEKITCTLVDWTEVTGSNQDVTIED
ncbi:MAG: fimbrillin family protein [Prevotella sp.]|nr:fimbrillin family protein [Prevotella sp.]